MTNYDVNSIINTPQIKLGVLNLSEAADIAANCRNIIARQDAKHAVSKVITLLQTFERKLSLGAEKGSVVSVTSSDFNVEYLSMLQELVLEHCPRATVLNVIDEKRVAGNTHPKFCEVTLSVTFK